MEIFNAIGLEIPPGKTLNDLAEDAEERGEASLSTRTGGTVHGRCWRIGLGLEVWTTLYEAPNGDVFYADCRPGFRARFPQNIECWALYEDEEEGEATVEGTIEDYAEKVFFQLQNLTEVSQKNFERELLTVGLCGLAYRAEVVAIAEDKHWQQLCETEGHAEAEETDWRLTGSVINFNELRNPFSGHDLFWIYLDLGHFQLEILVNHHILKGDLRIGAIVKADIWLQGHIVSQSTFLSSYEGVDRSINQTDFWRNLKRLN